MEAPFSLRAWYRRNGKWALVVLVVSIIGAGIVMLLRSFYEYGPGYYEPKDIPRGEHIEQMERGQKQ